MSYESIEEAAFRKLMAEIKSLRKEVAELKETLPIQDGNVSSTHKVYNNRQMCQLLNVSKGTLEKYRNEGQITFTRQGRKIFYSQMDLERFLKLQNSGDSSQTEGAGNNNVE